LAESALFAKRHVDDDTFGHVLDVVGHALEEGHVDHLVIGGIASAALGRARQSDDIDVFVSPRDAERLLEVLERDGFLVDRTFPEWLYKATRDGVLVDVIFCAGGTMYLDAEMLERGRDIEFMGRTLRIASAEDLLVSKVASHTESAARYWHDAVSLVSATELDWAYLLKRARFATRRVLSLLIYAQSEDIFVPDEPIATLFERVYGSGDERAA
jgi:predicted nucleotidyltransferase